MKRKMLLPILTAFLVLTFFVSTVQAVKVIEWEHESEGRLVAHGVYDMPFDDGWCKAVTHGVMVVKGYDGELYDVKTTMLQKIILYTEERGNIVAILKMTMQYVGTITALENGDPFENLYTGKAVLSVVLIELIEGILPEDKPETMHFVVWFEEGNPVRWKGKPPLP